MSNKLEHFNMYSPPIQQAIILACDTAAQFVSDMMSEYSVSDESFELAGWQVSLKCLYETSLDFFCQELDPENYDFNMDNLPRNLRLAFREVLLEKYGFAQMF